MVLDGLQDAGTAQLTSTGNLLGTPSYIAPELIRTQCPAAPRSDVSSQPAQTCRMPPGSDSTTTQTCEYATTPPGGRTPLPLSSNILSARAVKCSISGH